MFLAVDLWSLTNAGGGGLFAGPSAKVEDYLGRPACLAASFAVIGEAGQALDAEFNKSQGDADG